MLKCANLLFSFEIGDFRIDGSNTSGFQRTVLVAKEGYLDTKNGRVKIESICLEEDAARIIEKKEKIVKK